jgi:hypothetical protein
MTFQGKNSDSWKPLFLEKTPRSFALDLSKETSFDRRLRNTQPLDDIIPSLVESLSTDLKHKLNIVFEPHENLPTGEMDDLKVSQNTHKKYLESKNPHPRDKRIFPVDEPHVYFLDRNCVNVISSTTFIHAFFPHFDVKGTAQKMLKSKTFQETCHRPSHRYHGCVTSQDIFQRWNRWRDLGTDLHDNIECFINGESFDLDPDNELAFQRFMEFYNDSVFWTWKHFRTEWAVFDEEIRLAGKIDYVGVDPETGHLIILDWKRVLSIGDASFQKFQGLPAEKGEGVCSDFENCKFITYSLQLNVYKWILEKNYGVYVSKMYLVQLHPKLKTPVIIKVPNLQKYIVKMAACRKLAMK